MSEQLRLAGKIAHSFIDSKLTPMVIAAALLLGGFAIWQTPREEEPQIVVPMLDVMVQMPGHRRMRFSSASASRWKSYCAKFRASSTCTRTARLE